MIINLMASLTSFLVSTGTNFFLTPYITDSVGGTAAYGFVGLANNMIGYISIMTLALTSMSGRYITISIHEKNNEKSNIYFNSVLCASILLGILVLIISGGLIINLERILSIPDEIYSDVQGLFIVLILNFIVGLCCTAFSVATFSMNRLDLSSLRTIESNILRAVILIVLFMFLRPSIIFLGLATLAASVYTNVFNIYYTQKLLPQIKINRQYFSAKAMLEIVKSGLWNVFNRISGILSTGLDLLVTNLFVGATQMGILSISKSIPAMILSLFAMISNVFAPQIMETYAKRDIDALKNTLFIAIKLLGMISSIPIVMLLVFGQPFYELWLPHENSYLLTVLSVVSCFEFIFVLPLEPIWNVFTATNRLKVPAIYIFVNSIFSILIVFILLNLTSNNFLKLIIIAGVSTIVNIIRALVFLPLYGARCLGLKWNIFYKIIFKHALSVVLVGIFAMCVKSLIIISDWIDLIMSGIIVSIFAIIINYLFIMDKNEKYRLYLVINKLKGRKSKCIQ